MKGKTRYDNDDGAQVKEWVNQTQRETETSRI